MKTVSVPYHHNCIAVWLNSDVGGFSYDAGGHLSHGVVNGDVVHRFHRLEGGEVFAEHRVPLSDILKSKDAYFDCPFDGCRVTMRAMK